MTTIAITRDQNGKIVGAGIKDQAAYAKLKKALAELAQGEVFFIDVSFSRSRKEEGFFFLMLAAVHDAQDFFEDKEALRAWLLIGAGWCIYIMGPNGQTVAFPKSIARHSADGSDFTEVHNKVTKFLRSLYATRTLWPMLSDQDASEMIEGILRRVEDDRKRVLAERASND